MFQLESDRKSMLMHMHVMAMCACTMPACMHAQTCTLAPAAMYLSPLCTRTGTHTQTHTHESTVMTIEPLTHAVLAPFAVLTQPIDTYARACTS